MLQSEDDGLVFLLEDWELKESTGDTEKPKTQGKRIKKNNPVILRNGGSSKKQITAGDHLLQHLASESNEPFKVK